MSKQLDKHPGGRPTTYSDAIVTKAKDYIYNYEEQGDVIPSHLGLCKYIERSKTCIYNWATHKDKSEFKDILEQINELQATVLVNKGLTGAFNSNITKLVLGKHGYHDKQELSGDGGGPVELKINYIKGGKGE